MFDLMSDDGRQALKEKLNTDTWTTLKFKKKDGSVRYMVCALGKSAKLLKADLDRQKGFYRGGVIDETAGERAIQKHRRSSDETFTVVDIEINEWRSIRWDSITHIDGERVEKDRGSNKPKRGKS